MHARGFRLLFQLLSEVGLYFGPEARNSACDRFTCLFHCKPKPSKVSLESPGLENIPEVPGIGAKSGQHHDAGMEVGLHFGPEVRK